MKQPLPNATKAVLRKGSREAIEASVSILKVHFRNSRWVGAANRYRTNTIARLRADVTAGRTVNHFHLAQYVAASAPLHCADGWAFLGRAVDCHARRDYDSARHFAYYAELRAAFSLLAAEGIGIFERNHFAVEGPRRCVKFAGFTHQIAWQALEHWADLTRATRLLGSSIQVAGIALQEWLDHFPPSHSLRPVGSRWLKTWGLDLSAFADDRESRNRASYRPTTLAERPVLSVTESADFICNLWLLCEPTALSLFERLDRHLLRCAVEEIFKGVHGGTTGANAPRFSAEVGQMLSDVIPESAARAEWLNFLTRATEPHDPIIISEAKETESDDGPQYRASGRQDHEPQRRAGHSR